MEPRARSNNLLVAAVEDEIVIYDKDRDRVHSLNRTASLVWQRCDGLTNVAEMARVLQRELDLPADEGMVWLALDELNRAHLLEEPFTRPPVGTSISRRDILRKVGRASAAALLLPVVSSIVAPTPANAFSF